MRFVLTNLACSAAGGAFWLDFTVPGLDTRIRRRLVQLCTGGRYEYACHRQFSSYSSYCSSGRSGQRHCHDVQGSPIPQSVPHRVSGKRDHDDGDGDLGSFDAPPGSAHLDDSGTSFAQFLTFTMGSSVQRDPIRYHSPGHGLLRRWRVGGVQRPLRQCFGSRVSRRRPGRGGCVLWRREPEHLSVQCRLSRTWTNWSLARCFRARTRGLLHRRPVRPLQHRQCRTQRRAAPGRAAALFRQPSAS